MTPRRALSKIPDALTRTKMHGLLQHLCARHHPSVLLVTHDVDEAILLADGVLVLTEGQISLDVTVEIDGPRRRDTPCMIDLRSRLLGELGVREADETVLPDVLPVAPP